MNSTRRHSLLALALGFQLATACRSGATTAAAPAAASTPTASTVTAAEALDAELIAMGDAEQELRRQLIEQGARIDPKLVDELSTLDQRNTQRLIEIVAQHGWPTKSLFGAQGAGAAWLILQHSPDHEFQQRMLPELEHLMGAGEVRGSEYALLYDRVQMYAGRPQRYGSQFRLNEGVLSMHECEDPAHLDERRASVGLGTIAEYVRLLEETYKQQVAPVAPSGPR